MQKETISDDQFTQIEAAAAKGSFTEAVASLLTPNLQQTELAQDASYLVVESAYIIIIIRLDPEGRPITILERE